METGEIREEKESKRLPVRVYTLLLALGLFVTFGLYSTIDFGVLSLILDDETRHPGLLGHMVAEAGVLLAVLTSVVILFYFERRPSSDLGLMLKDHARGSWYGLLTVILLYSIGFGLSLALGEVEIAGSQFDPLNLLATFVFCLLVVLVEETMMRGYILGRLLYTQMSKSLSLLVFILLFALLHLSNPNLAFLPMLNLLLVGMLVGASYLYTRNLCFPISLHPFRNWIQGPILGYQVSGNDFGISLLTLRLPEENVLNGGAFGFEGPLICTVLIIIFTILTVWWEEKREVTSLAVPRLC